MSSLKANKEFQKIKALFVLYVNLIEERIKIIDEEVDNPGGIRNERLLKICEIIASFLQIDPDYLCE